MAGALASDPAFATDRASWALTGPTAWLAEPDDPRLSIPRGSFVEPGEAGKRSFAADNDDTLPLPAGEPLAVGNAPAARGRGRAVALVASCVFHVCAALFLLTHAPDAVLMEGSESAGLTLLGDAPDEQATPGPASVTDVTLITTLEAQPVAATDATEVTHADRVADIAPAEPEAVETLEPVAEAPSAEPAAADRVAPVLADAVDTIAPVLPERTDVQSADSTDTAAVETSEALTADVDPAPKPVAKPKRVHAEKKLVDKALPGKTKAAGSGGRSTADAKRGATDASTDGKTSAKGKGGKSAASGSAAVSNYPGKVMAKLRRAARGIPHGARLKAQRDVKVGFVVNASGGVGGVRIVQSSGSPDLDRAALDTVRRAAPFPPIPADAGRSSWRFTLPLGVAR